MHSVSGVTDRIAQIQGRIDQLSPQRGTSSAAFAAVLGGVIQAQSVNLAGPTGSAATVATALAAAAPDAGPAVVGSGLNEVDARGVPIALASFGNGRIPADALSTIEGTSHRLWAPAARSFEAMRSAAAAEGVTIGITDSYRTYESQVDLVERKGLYSQGGLAAEPGTSKHGWGVALDLKLDPTAQAWIRANGARYGYVENVPREPWHWQYKPLKP